jgi:hypothetical protein
MSFILHPISEIFPDSDPVILKFSDPGSGIAEQVKKPKTATEQFFLMTTIASDKNAPF